MTSSEGTFANVVSQSMISRHTTPVQPRCGPNVLYPSNGLGSGRATKKPKSTFSVIQALKFCSLVFGYYFANSFGELFPRLAFRGLDPSLLTPPPPALARLREQ